MCFDTLMWQSRIFYCNYNPYKILIFNCKFYTSTTEFFVLHGVCSPIKFYRNTANWVFERGWSFRWPILKLSTKVWKRIKFIARVILGNCIQSNVLQILQLTSFDLTKTGSRQNLLRSLIVVSRDLLYRVNFWKLTIPLPLDWKWQEHATCRKTIQR